MNPGTALLLLLSRPDDVEPGPLLAEDGTPLLAEDSSEILNEQSE